MGGSRGEVRKRGGWGRRGQVGVGEKGAVIGGGRSQYGRPTGRTLLPVLVASFTFSIFFCGRGLGCYYCFHVFFDQRFLQLSGI